MAIDTLVRPLIEAAYLGQAMVGRSTASVSVPRRGESQVCPGWRVVGIPDLGVGDRDQGPDLLHPCRERVDALGQGAGHDEVVWDNAAGCIPSFQGIGKAQCDLSGSAAPRCWSVS